jgi:hypothetical protein
MQLQKGNPVGPNGAAYLSNALKVNRSIRVLEFEGTQISPPLFFGLMRKKSECNRRRRRKVVGGGVKIQFSSPRVAPWM